MRYWIDSRAKLSYTERVLRHLGQHYRHEMVDTVDDADTVLISIADITEIGRIKIARRWGKPLIAGGPLTKVAPQVMAMHADLVWIGHAFEFFECRSLDDIAAHQSSHFTGNELDVYMSRDIRWCEVPAIQVDSRRFYLWGGVGCSRKCSFCTASWTENHCLRPELGRVVAGAKRTIGSRGTIKVVSNEYRETVGDELVQDMLLTDLLRAKNRSKKRKLIRVGLEFATEATRRKYAKPMTQETIEQALLVAERENFELHLFCIAGLDTEDEWVEFMGRIPESDHMKPRVHFKWTNLEYQQKTPLWRRIKQVDFSRYQSKAFTDKMFQIGAHRNKRVRVLPIKYPAHAVWRMLMSNVRTLDEYDEVYRLRNQKAMDVLVKAFYDYKPWETDLSKFHTRVGDNG